MTFWQALRYVYRESFAFLLACPLLALVPVLITVAQHLAEMRTGADGGLVPALLPRLALLLPGYWTVRFLAGGRDTAAARSADPRSLSLYALVAALGLLLTWLGLSVFPPDGPMGAGFLVFALLFAPLVARFVAGAPLGVWISPLGSIRAMLPHALFAIPLSLLAALPLSVSRALLDSAMDKEPEGTGDWIILLADSLLVGWLGPLLAAINYAIALRGGRLPPSAAPT